MASVHVSVILLEPFVIAEVSCGVLPGAQSEQEDVGMGVNVTCPRLFNVTFEEVSVIEMLSVLAMVEVIVKLTFPDESSVVEVGLKITKLLLESVNVTVSPDKGFPELSCRVTVTFIVE